MLDCPVCLSQCLRALLTPVRLPPRSSSTPSSLARLQRRPFHHVSPALARSKPKNPPKHTNYETHPRLVQALAGKRLSVTNREIVEKAITKRGLTGQEARRLGKLQLHTQAAEINDPYLLLDYVKAAIGSGSPLEKVETVIRKVSYRCNTVASWNYYIATILSDAATVQGRVSQAARAFAMMKKCSTLPDSHTYMTFFVGYLRVAETPSRAVVAARRTSSFFHGLIKPESKVKMTTMLSNAALHVCARAGEMDMVWDMAKKLPENGEGAPDHITYSIILNAMRNNISRPSHDLQKPNSGQIARTILDAKGIWLEIIRKHKTRSLALDASLVGAMGRILLASERPKDWDDILSLVAQVMELPRVFPALSSGPGKTQPRVRMGTFGPEQPRVEQPKAEQDPYADVFDSLGSNKKAPKAVVPTTDTLSLVFEACTKLSNTAGAEEYWKLLTDTRGHRIVPDRDNLHAVLRLYKNDGNSHAALRILQDDQIKKAGVELTGVTFRIALGSCKDVGSNERSFAHATGIIDVMRQHLPVPNFRTLVWYSELALQQKSPVAMSLVIERVAEAMRFIQEGYKEFGPIRGSGAVGVAKTKANESLNVLVGLIKLIDVSLSAKGKVDDTTVQYWRDLRREAQDTLHDVLHDEAKQLKAFADSIERHNYRGQRRDTKIEDLDIETAQHKEHLKTLAPLLDQPFGSKYTSRRRARKSPGAHRSSRVEGKLSFGGQGVRPPWNSYDLAGHIKTGVLRLRKTNGSNTAVKAAEAYRSQRRN